MAGLLPRTLPGAIGVERRWCLWGLTATLYSTVRHLALHPCPRPRLRFAVCAALIGVYV
jgi:hypothetical protein